MKTQSSGGRGEGAHKHYGDEDQATASSQDTSFNRRQKRQQQQQQPQSEQPQEQQQSDQAEMEYLIFGKDSGPTIAFIHGWPDNWRLFQKQIDALTPTHRVVAITLPGYEAKPKSFPCGGYEIVQLYEMFHRTILKVMEGRQEKIILVGHDWGAYFVYEEANRYPDAVGRIVAFDSGAHIGRLSIAATVLLVFYQWVNIFLYLLPSFIGTPLTRCWACFLGAYEYGQKVNKRMNYIYLRAWQALITHRVLSSSEGFHPPKCPVLFMYGKQKPFMLHSARWINHLNNTVACRAVSFAGNHWFIRRYPTQVTEEMLRFVKEASRE